jgi:hypothetical protein
VKFSPEYWWRGLARPWKAAVFGFLIGILWTALFGLLFADPLLSLVSSLLWAAAAGSTMRLRDRLRERRPPR